jgi:hypothetical protein
MLPSLKVPASADLCSVLLPFVKTLSQPELLAAYMGLARYFFLSQIYFVYQPASVLSLTRDSDLWFFSPQIRWDLKIFQIMGSTGCSEAF